jgi:lipopolysaccharide biosynthesis protein
VTRAIALYLPQFHPTPENDLWWGKGFTEWTNTAKARPLFRGHYQPHVPADLGFYDLRLEETRIQQAALAKNYGIEAFCYYHYWFAGKRLLNRPFDEVVASGKPDFPFCLCWANSTWSGIWHGSPNKILIEQTYPGIEDHRKHFETLLPAFKDPRYLRVDGKPIFLILEANDIPNVEATVELWREFAVKSGLGGLYLIGISGAPGSDLTSLGFDAVAIYPFMTRLHTAKAGLLRRLQNKIGRMFGRPHVLDFADFMKLQMPRKILDYEAYPTVVHAWDNTPRSGSGGVAYVNSTPEKFRDMLKAAVMSVDDKPPQRRLVFLKSWNEWAEGNHLEPDLKYGHAYLRVLAEVLK